MNSINAEVTDASCIMHQSSGKVNDVLDDGTLQAAPPASTTSLQDLNALLHTTEVSVIKSLSSDNLKAVLEWIIDQLHALQQTLPAEHLTQQLQQLQEQQNHGDMRLTAVEAKQVW